MRNILCTIIIASFLTACSNFLSDYSQDLSKVETVADLNELLLGDAYLPVGFYEAYNYSAPQPYNTFIHTMSDEIQQNHSTNTRTINSMLSSEDIFGYFTWQRSVGINSLETAVGTENECWKKTYKYINTTNMVLDELGNVTARNKREEADKIRIEGESHFLRALYYFTLVNLYAAPYEPAKAATTPGIPLKLTSYIEDKEYEMSTLEEVYGQIIDDLEEAEACLKQTETVSIYHADLTATYLLMSRVYLYMQDYKNARKYAEDVLSRNNALGDLNTFNDEAGNFLNKSLPEVIFSMGGHQLSTGMMGSEGRRHYDDERPFYISDDLIAAFDDDDLRKQHYIKEEGSYYILQKVRWDSKDHPSAKCTVSENFLFRTAEAYLNLAEAAALDEDEEKAREMIGLLQAKRFAVPPVVSATGNDLIDLIREERQRELCLEGHRWYDLRRYTVCTKYPCSKVIRHIYRDYKYDRDLREDIAYKQRVYELKEYDKAYTLALPHEVTEFQNTLSRNERPERQPVETIGGDETPEE